MKNKQFRYLLERMDSWMGELLTQTDRGAALIAAAVMDELLKHLLLKRLIELSEKREADLFDGPQALLSSFSAKIEMAFALGIVSDGGIGSPQSDSQCSKSLCSQFRRP